MFLKHKFSIMALFALGACAGPEAVAPKIDMAALEPERQAEQRAGLDVSLGLYERAHGLLWPLLAANTDYCPKVRPELGLHLADLDRIKTISRGLNKRELKRLGYDEHVRIAYVVPGSPAAEAGLKRDDRLIAINGEALDADISLKNLNRTLKKALEDADTVTLGIRTAAGETKNITVTPEEICSVRQLTIRNDGNPNASATTNVMRVTRGLLEAGEEDRVVQYVLAHELAHMTQRHARKILRNRAVTGSQIYGTAATFAALPLDILLAFSPIDLDVPLFIRAQQLTDYPWVTRFENEADYLGVYYLARAGVDVAGIERAFEYLAEAGPKGTYVGINHGDLPERVLAVRAAVEEIEAKRAVGQALIPEGLQLKGSS